MPYVRIELPAGRSREEKQAILQGIDAVLVAVLGVPANDAFLRIIDYTPDASQVPRCHGPQFTFVEIQLFPGRRPETKARLYHALVEALTAFDIPANDITIALIEIAPADWGIAGGVPASEIPPPFAVAV